MKLRVALTYRDEWTETIEVEVPDGATRLEADALRERAAERHQPAGPASSRLSPSNCVHDTWEGDPQFADERRRG